MGWVRFRRGDLAGALKWIEEAYTLKQTHPEIAAHLGEVLWKLGRNEEARRILDGAFTTHPDDAVLRKTIHRLYPKAGEKP
jgi:Flp pilus assembly protein TadD